MLPQEQLTRKTQKYAVEPQLQSGYYCLNFIKCDIITSSGGRVTKEHHEKPSKLEVPHICPIQDPL